MVTKSIVVLASGGGSDLQSILDAIDTGLVEHAQVSCVISDRAGAGALERARHADVRAVHVPPVGPTQQERAAHDAAIAAAIADTGGADLVVLAGYMRILGRAFVADFARRLINIHPALLPAYPGRDGPKDALHGGARISGCTTHFVDDGVDSGAIILQAAVAVLPTDDRDTLHARILAAEHQILPRTVDLFVTERIQWNGKRVSIKDGPSWHGRVPALPGVLYPAAF